MKIIEWQQFLQDGLSPGKKQNSMTVGIFDGVHRGHQELIKRIVSYNTEYEPMVVTFRENYKIKEEREERKEEREERKEKRDIQSFQERLAMFERFGVKAVVVIDFSEEFKQMPGSEFLQLLLEHCNIGFFAVGSDFRCGYRLDTDALAIQRFFTLYDIPVEIVPQVMEGSLPVSSSRIRTAIADGELALAQVMLGHD